MRRRPCGDRECREWIEEHGVCEAGYTVCYLCGFEGPMADWYADRDAEEEEKSWLEEQQ